MATAKKIDISQVPINLQDSALKLQPNALLFLSLSYRGRGEIDKALDFAKQRCREYYQQVLATAKQLKNRTAEGQALVLLANTSFALGEPQKTVEYAQQALAIFKEIKQPRLEAIANTMLGIAYGELGNDAKAMSAAETFLSFTRKVQNPVW